MDIESNIVKFREKKKLTQEELASIVKVSTRTIAKYERNKKLPDVQMLTLLSCALDVSINDILGVNEENKKVICEKYNKSNIVKVGLVLVLIMISVVYFILYSHEALIKLRTTYNVVGTLKIQDINNAWTFMKEAAIGYFVCLLFAFLSYLFYKKQNYKILLVYSSLLLILFLPGLFDFDYTFFETLILTIVFILGIIVSIKELSYKNNK